MLPSIKVKLRKDKQRDGKCAIVLQVYYNKKQRQIFTGLFIEEKHFNDGEIDNKAVNAAWYRQMIKKKVSELEANYLKQTLDKGEIEIAAPEKRSKANYFDYALDMYRGMSNRNSFTYIARSIKAIEDFKAFTGPLSFQAITPTILKEYEDHLFKSGLQRNTVNRIFKRIKQVFTQAVKDGTTEHNPFNHYKTVTYKQPKRDYLTIEQIKAIEAADMPEELDLIRNYFLLSCYTGLRFGDLQNFSAEKFIVVMNGVSRIIIGTTKTGEVVSIKLSNNVKSIIDKLNKPLPSNVHTNRLLKFVGKLAGIEQPINFHQSRHSFAVNSASFGIPIEAVSRLLGHSNIRTTAIYYKIADSKLDEYMDKWKDI